MIEKAVTLTYTLSSPPTKTSVHIPASQTTTYPIAGLTYSSTYNSTSVAILRAQKDLNESLTAWKDAIGDAEKSKEDLGAIAYGRGKAARMMQYAAGREAVQVDDDEDEDGE